MGSGVVVEFDENIQSLDAINAAAYRLIDLASCQIERREGRLLCALSPKDQRSTDLDKLRLRFLDLVTDENVRERLSVKTESVRNLILSLAFGALANQPSKEAE
jgi:His-Xaa-Ser system protein HxsD